MASRRLTQFFYTLHNKPILLDCNFNVDSTNVNGLGINSLKGGGIQAVYMQSNVAPAGSPAFGSARTYAALGASAVTNTGSSVLTGNLGIYPGSAITGFPPGSFTGSENIANAAALLAHNSAQASYTDLQARSSTVIASALDGQTLSAGVYSFASGAATLATSAPGTLTLNGSASDIFVIKTATTLTTGAGGAATVTLTGGALASNVYWVIGSSATLNTTGGSVFRGNLIANTSITVGSGDVQGSLVALNGAVTFSAATTVESQLISSNNNPANPNPGVGVILVKFQDNYKKYFGGFAQMKSPNSGVALTSVVNHQAYVISALGTATAAQWQAKGLPVGITPAVGASFIATASGAIGGSAAVQVISAAGSGIDHIEVIGNPDLSLMSSAANVLGVSSGSYMLLQCFSNGVQSAPVDGTGLSLMFYMTDSNVLVQGE